ncbi:hypothetical protein [Kineobactrum salinum]|uniref:hypothetical protein n=1 Tax=Kineobactrum salinum TaxID=2708301 RepID=UPI0018D90CEC|nr:hypothetical protein [Kineobactrum salinum]
MKLSLQSVLEQSKLSPGRLYIQGEWVRGAGDRFQQLHPANNVVMNEFVEAGERDVNAAVSAAREAFDKGPGLECRRMTAREYCNH